MSSLKHTDKIKLEKLFGMRSGYVCDFSDRMFGDFVLESTGVDVYTEEYAQGGTSKANRLRTFWRTEADNLTAKLIEALLEYWKTQQLVSGKDMQLVDHNLYLEGLKIVENLRLENTASQKKITTGIINEGQNNFYQNVDTVGLMLGSHDKGQRTRVAGGKHISKKDVGEQNLLRERAWWRRPEVVVFLILGIIAIVIAFVSIPWLQNWISFFRVNQDSTNLTSQLVATSTINISDVLSKALTLDTVVERQDFLKKYIGSQVYGRGVVEEISRAGDGFLVDVDINRQTITCPQSGDEENEKRLLLLKGRTISFSGVFTFRQIFEHGLEINDCVLQQK